MGRQRWGIRVAFLLLGMAALATTAAAVALHWTRLGRLSGTTGPQPAVAALAAHPTDPDVIYAGTWLTTAEAALIYRSADGGQTWQPATRGLPTDLPANGGVNDLVMHPADPDVLYVALQRRGVWRSDDGGASWVNVNDGALAPNENVVALAIDPASPHTIYALSDDGLNVLDNNGAWKAMNRGLPTPARTVYNDIALDPTDPGTAYIATNPDGLYRTTNGGRLWRSKNDQLPGRTLNVQGVTVTATGELFISMRGVGLLRSGNDGQTWSSSQTGITFTNTLFGTVSAPLFDPADPQVALAYNSDGVFRSSDGGATWARFGDGLSVTAVVTSLSFAPARQGVALVGTAVSGVWATAEDEPDPPDPPARRLFMPMIRN